MDTALIYYLFKRTNEHVNKYFLQDDSMLVWGSRGDRTVLGIPPSEK